MSGLFTRLFGKAPRPQDEVQTRQYDAAQDADVLGAAMVAYILPQVELIGFGMEGVPAESRFVTAKARGALYGYAIAILEICRIELSKDAMLDILIGVFGFVYGDQPGRELAERTFNEIRAGEVDTKYAADWARSDLIAVHEGDGSASAAGFYMAVNGIL